MPFDNTVASSDLATTSVVSLSGPNNGAVATSGQRDAASRAEMKRLGSTHPLYDIYKPLWDFYLASYEGGQSFANEQNLFKHAREHPDDFRERAKRIYYHNFVFPLIDFFTTFIFTETIQRNGGALDQWYAEFNTNVDRRGQDITAFMMEVSDVMQIYGMCYVLVDSPPKPPADSGPVSVSDEAPLGLRPYWVLIRPDEILDWVVDDFDKFAYIKRLQTNVLVDPATMKPSTIETYTEWTPTRIRITKVDVTNPNRPVIASIVNLDNEVEAVPVEVVRFKRSKVHKHFGESFLRDMAFIAREVMNITSLLQEFLYRQCFNLLAMEEDDGVPEREQMEGDVGTANLLKYPKGAHIPSYVTPPVAPAKFLSDERSSNIAAMYSIAAQDTVNELFNGGKASGFSKSQSFQKTVPKIATRADSLESLEYRLMTLTTNIAGKGTWGGTIKYKDHYEVTNLTDSLNQMGTLFRELQIQSKTFASTQLKRMVAEFDGKLSAEQLAQVNKEIDSMDWDEYFDTQKLAFIGRAATSPDAALAFGLEAGAGTTGADPSGAPPVKGKDSPTAASTPQRPSPTSATVKAASSKQPVK